MVTTRSRSGASPRTAPPRRPVILSPHFSHKRTPSTRTKTRSSIRTPLRSKYFAKHQHPTAKDGSQSVSPAPAPRGSKSSSRSKKRRNVRSSEQGSSPPPPTSGPMGVHGLSRSSNFYGLIQELVAPNVFRLLVSTCLLNQTRGRAAIPVFWELLARWPDEHALALASLDELTALLQPLGLHNIRARRLIALSVALVATPYDPANAFKARASGCPLTPIGMYPGVGRYAIDSYRIFIAGGGAHEGLQGQRPIAPAELRLRQQRQQLLQRQLDVVDDDDDDSGAAASPQVPPQTKKTQETIEQLVDAETVVSSSQKATQEEEHEEETEPEWKKVQPLDKELRAYLIWRWAKEGITWHPDHGAAASSSSSSSC